MRAMMLDRPGGTLQLTTLPPPEPAEGEVLVSVHACGICRTDLHIVDGDIQDGSYPVIPGHQIVGHVMAHGPRQTSDGKSSHAQTPLPPVGSRVGIPWLGHTCGHCDFCRSGTENLCDSAEFTGYQRHGGFAELVCADARFCLPLPDTYPDLQAAPLLCAGLIGYRALRMTGDAQRIGFYGFGNAAHILTQIAAWQGRQVYAFTRPGDKQGQAFARSLGACWAGSTDQQPDQLLDAGIIFAPAGELLPLALAQLRKGGRLICAGIHMSEIPAFPYHLLWGERSIASVANLTRDDGLALLELAPQVPVRTQVQVYELPELVQALDDLRAGRITGGGVIRIGSGHQ